VLRQRNALVDRSMTPESRSESISFLGNRGFVETQRFWQSRLDVTTFDFSKFADAGARPTHARITTTTLLAEREHDPAAARASPSGARHS